MSLVDVLNHIKHAAEAKLKTELLPHQERVIRRILENPGLVVAHGLGSGKTLSSIAAAVKLQPDKTQVLVPAALQENYRKEIKKHVEGTPPIEIGSLQGAAVKGDVPDADLLVVDEAHRGRNPQSKTYKLIHGAQAKKRLMLTASPTYNRPSDVAALINMAAGDSVLPMGSEFEKRYIAKPHKGIMGLLPFTRKSPELKGKEELKRFLRRWVDYHKSGGKDFPSVIEEKHSVPMSPRQTKLHDAAWNRLSLLSKLRLRRGLPPDKKDLPKINAFQSQTRQISSSEGAYTTEKADLSPKIKKAISLLYKKMQENREHRALVYSNYLRNLEDYSRALKEKGIPHAIFSGKQTNRNRKAMVEDYNKGKLKALLVSSAGGEGLDLKGTRQVQVLEPHWNTEKLKQVEGRAIRRGSHTHLPKKDQNVVLQRFEAYPLGGIIGKRRGVEQVLADMAANKEKLNQELLSLLPGDRGVKKKASLNKLSQQEKAMSLVDVLNQLETADEEMEKEAQEHEKIAAEEEAAGRITARGFMDELNKLAQAMQFKPEKVGPSAAALPKKNIGGALPPPVKPGSVVQPGKGAGMAATQKKQQRLYR